MLEAEKLQTCVLYDLHLLTADGVAQKLLQVPEYVVPTGAQPMVFHPQSLTAPYSPNGTL